MSRRLLVLLTASALVFGVRRGLPHLARRLAAATIPPVEMCQARVDGHLVELDLEQSRYAALIAAVSVQRGMPARAATIALATAYQESDLRNLEYGDRDSLGLFQQRPSQGWGSREQLLDPYYATNAFYDALAQVDGYPTMPVTEAAQEVQRSGFPDAYADHEPDARVLASALTGNSPRGVLVHRRRRPRRGLPRPRRRRADGAGRRRARRPRPDVRRPRARRLRPGRRPRRTHARLGALRRPRDRRLRAAGLGGQQAPRLGHRQLPVGQADRLGIATVIFDDRVWKVGDRSRDGWQDYRVPSGSKGDRSILEHRDHVHVDVSR